MQLSAALFLYFLIVILVFVFARSVAFTFDPTHRLLVSLFVALTVGLTFLLTLDASLSIDPVGQLPNNSTMLVVGGLVYLSFVLMLLIGLAAILAGPF